MTRRLAEVAKHVGVSQATVSRVLNDKPGISEATRTAVLTALDVLGYERPTKLRGERARLVGLVMPEFSNPVFPAFAEAAAGALAKQGFTPVLCTRTIDAVPESDYLDILFEQNASGVIFAGGLYQNADAEHGHYLRLRERGLPAVLINAASDRLGLPAVSTDDTQAVDQAYGHLASLGHQHIGVILGPSDHTPSARKLAAYLAARTAHRGTGSLDLVGRAQFTMEHGHAVATRLIGNGATGLVCGSDVLALGAIRAAHRLGLAVPGDVSVIGYDDSAVMTHTEPPLTTIRQPMDAMAQAAVAQLISHINGHSPQTDELLYEAELVVRSSTGPVRATSRAAG